MIHRYIMHPASSVHLIMIWKTQMKTAFSDTANGFWPVFNFQISQGAKQRMKTVPSTLDHLLKVTRRTKPSKTLPKIPPKQDHKPIQGSKTSQNPPQSSTQTTQLMACGPEHIDQTIDIACRLEQGGCNHSINQPSRKGEQRDPTL